MVVDCTWYLALLMVTCTSGPAETFGMPDVGQVKIGGRANLLLLGADPRQSIDAYSRIVKVIYVAVFSTLRISPRIAGLRCGELAPTLSFSGRFAI